MVKDRKRVVIYSLLALPFVVFGIFFLTLDPIAQANFFGDFKAKTAKHFGFVDEIPDVNSGAVPAIAPGPAAEGVGTGGAGGRRGGFDREQFFADRDTDGDGKLTGDEIPERMQDNLERIDSDQDGSVTLEEMQAGMRNRRGGRGGRRRDPAQVFSRSDEDGDGKLTGDEIGERIRENLSSIDADQDGSVTLEEFEAGMQNVSGPQGSEAEAADDSPE